MPLFLRKQLLEKIEPSFVQILVEQVIQYYPFSEPQTVGCDNYFIVCMGLPIYSFDGLGDGELNRKRFLKALANNDLWQNLQLWFAGENVKIDFSIDQVGKFRSTLASLVLIRLFLDLGLPLTKWGFEPRENSQILLAAYKSYPFLPDPNVFSNVFPNVFGPPEEVQPPLEGPDLAARLQVNKDLARFGLALPTTRKNENPWQWPRGSNTPQVNAAVELLKRIAKRREALLKY